MPSAGPLPRDVPPLGAHWDPGGVTFRAHAAHAAEVLADIVDRRGKILRTIALAPHEGAVFEQRVPDLRPGTLYTFRVDGRRLPDPYARWMPEGVHGPAAVVDATYEWRHPLRPRSLRETVFYELHVGTFTPEGTYAAARSHLAELAALGVTTIELLPIAAFPGRRGWGYDGVAPFAPFPPYGTPSDLRAFVDEAHGVGLSVALDVVYNHFGPDGNYLPAYSAEYFSADVPTPWGAAPNFANPFMRTLVRDSARSWLVDYRFDALRLDATHAIVDRSEKHILRTLADDVAALSPRRLLIAEDERNLPSVVRDLGMDGVWADDFHHGVHVLATGERDGYYAGFTPRVDELARTIQQGWLYEGKRWPLTGQPRGAPAAGLAASNFVYSLQNHDQVGNRALGDRILSSASSASSARAERLAALSMLLLFLPATPLLFMGQEWGSSTPFLYFSDHEPALGAKVTQGRRAEFAHFASFKGDGALAEVPDPQAEDTFLRSKLAWTERRTPAGRALLALVGRMLELRRTDPVFIAHGRDLLHAVAHGDVLFVTRDGRRDDPGSRSPERRVLAVNFGAAAAPVPAPTIPHDAERLVSSHDGAWRDGILGPYAAALFALRGAALGLEAS